MWRLASLFIGGKWKQGCLTQMGLSSLWLHRFITLINHWPCIFRIQRGYWCFAPAVPSQKSMTFKIQDQQWFFFFCMSQKKNARPLSYLESNFKREETALKKKKFTELSSPRKKRALRISNDHLCFHKHTVISSTLSCP